MITLIDNYDSFTYNLVHFIGQLGVDVTVHRNDQISVDEVLAESPQAIVLSPGPCDPDRAGICLPMVEAAARNGVPLFGVCLGHQSIGQAFGGKVVRAPSPMHGKVSAMHHDDRDVFEGLSKPLAGTRYHSLVVDRASLPDCFEITAWTDDGLIMGLRHKDHIISGVQFHPESIATRDGHKMLANFLAMAGLNPNLEGVKPLPIPTLIETGGTDAQVLAGGSA